jgi:erythromycin esterase-like protein
MKASLRRRAATIGKAATAISGPTAFDPLVEAAGEADVVLIGEASHGTREFYATRADLTRRLIEEKGFRAVAWEADWPDTFRVHRYVTGQGVDRSADQALSDFRRFPAWMWRNSVVLEFVEWLRGRNLQQARQDPAGVYGMDLYSMHASIASVLGYLDRVNPEAAQRARQRYACFDHFSEKPEAYGFATTLHGSEACDDEVIEQLVELRRRYHELRQRDGRIAEEEFFSAEQNARLVMNAERYYRAMYQGRDESWNLRDTHMFETLLELREHLHGAKIVVWAHNSHLGDARATQMSQRGELNVGQLVKERFGTGAFSIGFTTYTGTVTAAEDWGEPARRRHVRPGLAGSCEELFHAVDIPEFWLDLRGQNDATELLDKKLLQRAIGVIYRPDTERWSHYFDTRLSQQFDAVIHLDETQALEPLEPASEWASDELPETYPSAL